MRSFDTFLLDVDGTLVDSNDAHAHAWVETLASHGHAVEFARVRRMIGMGGDRLVEELAYPASSSSRSWPGMREVVTRTRRSARTV